jgi:hypothetical protein
VIIDHLFRDFPHMLTARRDDYPHTEPYAPLAPPRSLVSRFTTGMQLVGSIIGVPLALIGGYSTYHTTFSPEARCQALRGNIVAMLDKQADATTLRMLVQRDVATFQHDCVAVDPDAVAAFKNLMRADHTQQARHLERQTSEPARPAKAEAAAKTSVPAKSEAAKSEPVKAQAVAKAAPGKGQAPPAAAAREPEKVTQEPKAAQQVKEPEETKEQKPIETASIRPEADQIDSAWIASVRDALRESASRPLAVDAVPEAAAPMPPPVVVTTPPNPQPASPQRQASVPRPPADLMPRAERSEPPPVPPASIPDAEAPAPSEN